MNSNSFVGVGSEAHADKPTAQQSVQIAPDKTVKNFFFIRISLKSVNHYVVRFVLNDT